MESPQCFCFKQNRCRSLAEFIPVYSHLSSPYLLTFCQQATQAGFSHLEAEVSISNSQLTRLIQNGHGKFQLKDVYLDAKTFENYA